MSFKLTDEQRTAVENRGGALLVSAAAGSGKTRVLVERLMDYVVREGENIDRFLIITFTNAAAAELRARIVKALAERLAEQPYNGHLRRQTTLVHQAKICTIDSFCKDFLRECGHLADVDPDFRICDEAEGHDLLTAALNEVLEHHYANLEHDPDFAELAESLSGDRDDVTLSAVVLDILRRVNSHADPMGWLRARKADFALPADAKPEDTVWGKLLLEDGASQAAYWADALERALNESIIDEVTAANYGPSIEITLSDLTAFSLACREGWEEASRCEIRFPRAGTKKGADPAARDWLKGVRERCKKQMEAAAARFDLSAQDAVADLRALSPAMSALLTVAEETDAAFRARKARRHLLDFSDLEHLAVSLLADQSGAPTQLAREWQGRFREIMVDEYQDTNAVQNVLFNVLSQEGKNLFLVGDVKQSIYRFRLADPGIFLRKYDRYPNWDKAANGEPRKALLSANFRSRPEVLAGVNFLFSAIMSREFGELDYTEEESLHLGREKLTPDPDYNVELNAIDLDDLSEDAEDEKVPKALIQARAVAQRASDYLNGGLLVADGEMKRPARPEDMVILLRSPGPVLRYYAQAFDEAGIPWSADGGEEFFDTTEIHTALSFLQIIDNPRQDIPLLAVIRSPLFQFSPDRLAVLRASAREGDFYSALAAGADRGEEDCVSFLSLLGELRSLSGELSSHQLIWELYAKVNLPAIFASMEGGQRRRTNLMALYDAALRFESGGHKGLYGFLSHVAHLIESGQTILTPQEAQGGVKIMSIHRSKGLEFPIVFLCGLDRQFNDSDLQAPILFHSELGLGPKRTDRSRMLRYPTIARDAVALTLKRESRAEEMRLLYVAMTRAEQKLVLFTTVNGSRSSLSTLVNEASWPIHPKTLQACSSPAGWVLLPALCRPESSPLLVNSDTVPPRCPADGFQWEMNLISAARFERPLHGRGHTALPERESVPADPALVEKLLWVYPHAASVDMPSKLTATQLKGRIRDEEIARHTDTALKERRGVPLARPRFTQEELGLTAAQKGTALHQAMQFLDLSARVDTPEGVNAELDRLVAQRFLTPQQRAAVSPDPIVRFFRSSLGKQLLAAPNVEREFKFSLLVPALDYDIHAELGEEVLLQGIVDCWFENEDGITVIDFKTDYVTKDTVLARAKEYTPQLAAYSRALTQVLCRPVKRRCLWFFKTGQSIEV